MKGPRTLEDTIDPEAGTGTIYTRIYAYVVWTDIIFHVITLWTHVSLMVAVD